MFTVDLKQQHNTTKKNNPSLLHQSMNSVEYVEKKNTLISLQFFETWLFICTEGTFPVNGWVDLQNEPKNLQYPPIKQEIFSSLFCIWVKLYISYLLKPLPDPICLLKAGQ